MSVQAGEVRITIETDKGASTMTAKAESAAAWGALVDVFWKAKAAWASPDGAEGGEAELLEERTIDTSCLKSFGYAVTKHQRMDEHTDRFTCGDQRVDINRGVGPDQDVSVTYYQKSERGRFVEQECVIIPGRIINGSLGGLVLRALRGPA